jgi:YD repeat-containing protein
MSQSSFRAFFARYCFFSRSKKQESTRATPCLRRLSLRLERLEDRIAPVTDLWINSGGGNWGTASNWSTGLPSSVSDVVIPALGSGITITHSTGSDTVHSVTSGTKLTLTAGTLNVTGNVQMSSGATFILQGGTLSNATVAAGSTLTLTGSGGTLAGVTIASGATVDGTQNIGSVAAYAFVTSGLAVNGTVDLGSASGSTYGILYLQGSQALAGSGTLVFGGSGNNGLYALGNDGSSPATLSIGSSITVQGGSGSVCGYYTNDSLINDGTITVASGQGLRVGGSNWVNAGTIDANGATVNLVGSLTTAALGNFSCTGGTVNLLDATLNNAGTTLVLSPALGAWELDGGTIIGGTISSTGGSKLALTGNGGTLSGVTIAAGTTVDGAQTPPGLAAFYSFDTGPNDQSGNGNNGTLSPNPPMLTSAGFQGSAYQFTAANNNFITVPVNIRPSAMPQMTMGGWFDASNTNSEIRGLLSSDDGGYDRTIDIDTRNGGVKWSAFSGYGVVSGAAVVANQWVFVAVCYNQATGTMLLDVNGSITTASTNFDSTALNTLTIGRNPNFDFPFDGKIDDVFVCNQFLTPVQLANIQQGPYAFVTGGMTLDGTLDLGASNGITAGRIYFNGTQTLSGSGTVVLGGSGSNALYALGNNGNSPATLTIGSGITVQGGSGIVGGYYSNDSVVNDGTITVASRQALTIDGSNWVNAGTITADGATVNLGGTFNTAALGNFTATGGTVNLTGTLNNAAAILNLNPAEGSWNVTRGTILGGMIDASGGSELTLTGTAGTTVGSGGTLDGVTLNGNLDLSAANANATVLDGLTLNGTATLGFGCDLYFKGSQTLGGTGTVVFLNELTNALIAASNGMTLTIGAGITIRGGGNQTYSAQVGYSSYWGGGSNTSLINEGTIIADTAGMIISVQPQGNGTLTNTGTLSAVNGGTLNVPASVTFNGQAILSESPSSNMEFTGNLLATATNVSLYKPQGTVTMQGAGTASAPQLLEAMSADVGSNAAGFTNNFAYGTLVLANKTYVELVNQSINSPGSSAEALYANSLVVPSGCTLNLNGLNLYVRDAQVAGTITGGSITQIPNSGPLTIDSPTPGKLSVAGELDNWTFFGRGGDSLTIAVDPGSGVAGGPISPQLQWAQVQLLDPSNNVLATASSTTAGAILTLNNVLIATDGTYTIAVKAASSHASSTGNYVVAAYDVTPNIQTLNVNQTVTGTLATPYSTDQWTFSAAANTQVQLNLLATSATGLNFSLIGPNGFSGFTKITGSSTVLNLPNSGTYTLTAQGTGGAVGTFTFDVAETTPTALPLATPYSGTFVGTGQAQLFAVSVPSAEPLFLQLADSAATDHVELYARFGALPTRATYDYAANGTGPSQSLLVPSAVAGTWYVLVYAELVAVAPSSFTLQADASPAVLTAVTPVHYGTNAVASLTLNGAGFTSTTSVALIAANNTVYPATSVSFNTFTQLTATVNLAGVPQGTYSVRVSNADGSRDTLPAAFTVTAAGQANLQTHLILPAAVGRHVSSTFYVQYSNTGSVAMAAPVLLLESTVADDRPLFTLNPALRVAGFWTSAIPEGYSNTVEILASGKVPGVLEPGESVTVPVYYAGMQMPWNFNEPQFHFDLRIFNTTDTDAVNWSSLQASLQPAGISTAAWSVIFGNLVSQLGNTWGGYVRFLDNEASYLGQLGEVVTDVNQLWGFGVQQANNTLSPVGPTLTSVTDDAMAMPGSLSLSFSRVFASTISGRNTLGPLGYGWSTPWQTAATTASDGTVTIIGADGAQRIFQPDSRTVGTFFSEVGDTGTLHSDGKGGYLLTEANGTATDYNPNGTLNYIEDTNGNRITAGYTGGRLVSLTASSGQSIAIAYNSSGLISSVSDSEGRTTTYAYDLANMDLVSVTSYNGQTTTYTYDTQVLVVNLLEIVSPQIYHALTSIAFLAARMSISPTTPQGD